MTDSVLPEAEPNVERPQIESLTSSSHCMVDPPCKDQPETLQC
jgi:hypothetical protein